MIRNIKLYFSFLGASIKKMMEYRIDFLVGLVSQFAFQIVELIFMWIIFQNTDNIASFTFEHVLLMYGVMMLSISILDFLFDSTYSLGRVYIRKGKFDTMLLRPVHPLISLLGESSSATSIGYFVIAFGLIVTMIIKLKISLTVLLVLKILFFGVIGALIMGGIQTIFSVSGFFTYKSNEVVWSVFEIHKFAQYPIEIYNKFIRILITCVFPFAFASYYPTLNYLGMENGNLIYLSLFVLVAVWCVAVIVWNMCLKMYRSTGN